MYLSENFTLEELTKSQTAIRLGIDNTPPTKVIENLKHLAQRILQPVRNYRRLPIFPSSAYRCLALNRLQDSKDTSQHVLGQAVDFEVLGFPNPDLARWILNNLEFDQLILEFHTPGQPNSGWVHCSYRADGKNRKEVLTFTTDKKKLNGLVE